ncbi:MAG: translation initiation factor IF-2 subunit alpha [Thermoplasmata archaeon]
MVLRLHEFPTEGDHVVGTVLDVKNFGAFVYLDEYEKEGFIHVAEVATGWIKYIRDHIREGQKIVCKVLRIDTSKGHIDLSLKQVNEHQRKEKIQEWKNEQKAEKLFEILAKDINRDVETCYKEFGHELIKTYGSLYGAFEGAAFEKKLSGENLKGNWVEHFIKVASDNIALPTVTISGIIEVSCPLPDGVVHVKDALIKAEKEEEDVKINIRYVGAPRYRIKVTAVDYKKAEKELAKAVDRTVNSIIKHNGNGTFYREGK